MPTTYTFTECMKLLQTNPKSFHLWLARVGIDPSTQVDLADPRKKYLTREQLMQVAEQHGRSLPSLDDDREEITLEALAKQLEDLQLQQVTRFDQLEQELRQNKEHGPYELPEAITQRLDELQQSLTVIEAFIQHIENTAHSSENVTNQQPAQATSEITLSTQSTTTSSPAKIGTIKRSPVPTKAKALRKKKKPTRKKLPVGLVLLRDFAGQHGIMTDRASAAGKAGKITVEHGKWLVNSRWATEALNAQGRQEFYQHFHQRESFKICEQCPHIA